MMKYLLGVVIANIFVQPLEAKNFTASQLIGNWAEKGTSCQSDSLESYEVNGRFGTDYSEGKWRLSGDRLTVTITREGELGEKFKLIKPRSDTVLLLVVEKHFRIEKWANGSLHRWVRCR